MSEVEGVGRTNILQVEFDNVTHLIGDLYKISQDEKCGVYDRTKKRIIVPVSFEDLYRLTDSSYLVKVNGRWRGFCIRTKEVREVFPLAA